MSSVTWQGVYPAATTQFKDDQSLDLAHGLEQEVAQKTSRLGASERKYRMLFEDSQDAICLFGSDGIRLSARVLFRKGQ